MDSANAKFSLPGPLSFVNCIANAPTAVWRWWNPGTKRITYRMKLRDGTTKVLYLGRSYDTPVLMEGSSSASAWEAMPVSD
ncbi:hypothetical protein [Streptomyces umbrinus]|uniref:hypothetical protein n=1 Tax=Streptomyces umbrinus TaxID=67370 RepID=UPI0027D85527|nr:hypothetical protein [Streptomyces umbrinus]